MPGRHVFVDMKSCLPDLCFRRVTWKESVDKGHVTRWIHTGNSAIKLWSMLHIKGAYWFKDLAQVPKWHPLPLNISTTFLCDLDIISPPWNNKVMLNSSMAWFKAQRKAPRCVWNHHQLMLEAYKGFQAHSHLLEQPLLYISRLSATTINPPVSLSILHPPPPPYK